MEDAVEQKRQTSNFIDITREANLSSKAESQANTLYSHEMRNPLSAILQCADAVVTTMAQLRNSIHQDSHTSKLQETLEEIAASTVDSAQTITLCAQHQRTIVDDILTLSKLDSQLLLVTPVDVQPLAVAQRAMKMHASELQTADIQLKFVVNNSYQALGIDWVKLDPSRVLQVLINLTTNAIKFTTTEKKRTITVTIGASTEMPSKMESRVVEYFPARNKRTDLFAQKDWGEGEEVFIHFAVQDTGRGLNDEEKKMLFLRFSQASPRTHVQYGGSGLGLFISRELTELQGGEIGVASEAGVGSTFAFYVKAKRTNAPTNSEGTVTHTRLASDAQSKKIPAIVNANAKNTIDRASSAASDGAEKVIKVLVGHPSSVRHTVQNRTNLRRSLRTISSINVSFKSN